MSKFLATEVLTTAYTSDSVVSVNGLCRNF